MPTYTDLLNDIKLRYRHTFTDAQVLVWLNEELRELYDILEIDSPPFTFQTMWQENFYSFPANFDLTRIKTMTYQVNDGDGFIEIHPSRSDDYQYADSSEYWYSLVAGGKLYLNIPGGVVDNRTVFIYCDAFPDEVTTATISNTVDLPIQYQEILKLGVLERISAARKDGVMKNNFTADKEDKISNILWQRKMREPEWSTTSDVMPKPQRWC